MKLLFDQAKRNPRRVVTQGELPCIEGGSERTDEGVMRPILIGRRRVISLRIEQLGL